MSMRLQSFGLETQWLMKFREKPRMMPAAVSEPLRNVASIFYSGSGSGMASISG
jgi:hypothetical protein